ncbi:hypothetical protein PHMEG_00023225 [Phytophthora megakarya]|uniref:Uncharacterized protein n=1 Tax=Phytophthora megakarya TaxID=4795 RepID=A0A225VIX7_9STRA|nr:hypothetical protein PHMEG_00023225 [Phytophthora megakarya]
MTQIPTGINRNQALNIISKWIVRYARGDIYTLRPYESSSSDVLIEKTIKRRIVSHEKIFRQHLPFSVSRFCLGLVSLLLVFSDIFHSGLSVSNLQKFYSVLQPDEILNYGTSWNYSVFNSTKHDSMNCSTKTARIWNYKFDSSSIVWRAYARHFGLLEFPDCIFYHEACPSKVVCGDVAFKMIVAFVNALAVVKRNKMNTNSSNIELRTLSLRTQSNYIDRFHQLLLPRWFMNVNWRTSQALYYSPELLARTNYRTICFPNIGERARIPHFCRQLWVNFQRSCAVADAECRAVGLLYVHMLKRLHDIQEQFPKLTVDLVILESQDDLQVNRGGLASLGFRWTDVSTIIRA